MATNPLSHLFPSPTLTVAISGPHFHVLDSNTGDVLRSTTTLPADRIEELVKAGPIRCAAASSAMRYFATVADDKFLKVWGLSEGEFFLNERELPKRPTCIQFTVDCQRIIISDKFGDVFSYSLHLDPTIITSKAKEKGKEKPPAPKSSLVSHPAVSDGKLILGHASLLTSFLLTTDEKYIITADRDEHIRVSWYPQGYNIESYCLGCAEFVSALHIPPTHPEFLISGGGDPELKIWTWASGSLVKEIPIWDIVKEYVLVRVKASFQKRRKLGDDENAAGDEEKFVGNEIQEDEKTEGDADVSGEAILVVKQIETLGEMIVFSVVGGSALFWTPFSTSSEDVPTVQAVDFSLPVLDFRIVNRTIWVSLNCAWKRDDAETTRVMVVQFDENNRLISVDATAHAIILSLNTIEGFPTDNLYDALLSYPKNKHILQHQEPTPDPESRRQKGRMRNKNAVLKKLKQEGDEERDTKKLKGESEKVPEVPL